MRLPLFPVVFLFIMGEVRGQLKVGTEISGANLNQKDCPFGIHGTHEPDSCICLTTGLWRVSEQYCSAPLTFIGVSVESKYCFYNTYDKTIELLEKSLTFKMPEVAQFSASFNRLVNRFDNSTTEIPFTEPVYQSPSTLITFGEPKWTLKTPENETFCLIHGGSPLSEYCIFPSLEFADKFVKVQAVTPNCDEMLPRYRNIQSSKCTPFQTNQNCNEALKIKKVDPAHQIDAINLPSVPIPLPNINETEVKEPAELKEIPEANQTLELKEAPELNKPTALKEPTELKVNTERTDATELKVNTERTDPTELNATTELNKSIESNKPVEFEEPAEVIESVESNEPIESKTPTRSESKEAIEFKDTHKKAAPVIINYVPIVTSTTTTLPPLILTSSEEEESEESDEMFETPLPINYDIDPDTEFEKNLVKRGSNNSMKKGLPKEDLNMDEDDVPSNLQEIGHILMGDQIDSYVDTVVAKLIGFVPNSNDKPGATLGRYPVLKLLEIMKMIMQRTCSPVKGEYFEMALNTFTQIQQESFHIKEPFVNPSAYRRIEYALKKCYNKAKAHAFHLPSENPKNCEKDKSLARVTAMELDVYGNGSKIIKLDPTPASARALLEDNATREPLIETAWKMVVNAHSYCYPYFKAYFNDHQTLTVSLLPLFNNQIQDIWLKTGGYDTTKGRLYGGLLGDTKKILQDVDNCVAASRFLSKYPWYMSRPMRDSSNKWRRRRKRDLDLIAQPPSPTYLNNGTELCMFDLLDPERFLDKPTCT